MAALGKIRQRSGLLIAVIGIALAAFILGDLLKSSNSRGGNVPVGIVNGEEVNYKDYNRKADQNIENQRQNSQTANLSSSQQFSVKKGTWDQIVKKIIMDEEIGELGVTVSKEELYDLVQGKNPHRIIKQYFRDPKTNEFNGDLVRQYIQNLDQLDAKQMQQWLSLEKYLKEDRVNVKYNNLVLKGYYLPETLAKMDYFDKSTKADVDFFGIKYGAIADDEVTITEQDYQDYYEKTKQNYRSKKESRKVEYVVFNIKASKEDVSETEKQVNDLFSELEETAKEDVPSFINATSDKQYADRWFSRGQLPARIESVMFSSEVGSTVSPYLENNAFHFAQLMETTMRPDSMKASHVLIAYQGSSRSEATRSKEDAQQLADSLYKVLKRSPAKFAAMSKQYSDGPSSTKGGDLGWFADGNMVPAFNEAVIDNRKGSVVQVETMFGFHIIKVTGKKASVKKVKVAQFARAIVPSSKTYQNVYMKASAFAGENETYQDFEKSVAEQGVNKRSTGFITTDKNNIPGLENPRQLVRWAFNEETVKDNVSGVMDEDKSYIVATLVDVQEEGFKSLAEVKKDIEPLVRREKKAEKLIKQIEDKGVANFEKLALSLGAEIKHSDKLNFKSFNLPGFGREVEAVAKIFNLEENKTSDPIQGNMAVYIVRLNKLNKSPELNDYSGTRKALESAFMRRGYSIYKALEANAVIEDNTLIYF
ncbi:MAG: peptidylprolyl isomerase [Bacteroidota bacterium]|nr:peptidylprolyl isomerase [Bacteroidota bacterium]